MGLECKRPWQLVVVALLFVLAGLIAVYWQIELLQARQHSYRLDVFFLPIGIGLLLRWRFALKLAQWALALGFAVIVLGLLGVPFGFTHIEYVTGRGPHWLQLLVLLLLAVATFFIVLWMFAVTLRPNVENSFEHGKEQIR